MGDRLWSCALHRGSSPARDATKETPRAQFLTGPAARVDFVTWRERAGCRRGAGIIQDDCSGLAMPRACDEYEWNAEAAQPAPASHICTGREK